MLREKKEKEQWQHQTHEMGGITFTITHFIYTWLIVNALYILTYCNLHIYILAQTFQTFSPPWAPLLSFWERSSPPNKQTKLCQTIAYYELVNIIKWKKQQENKSYTALNAVNSEKYHTTFFTIILLQIACLISLLKPWMESKANKVFVCFV